MSQRPLDPATGLPSAPSFFLALELAASHAQAERLPLAVLVIGLDAAPPADVDGALLLMAKVMRLALGPAAVLARLEGERFGVMLRGTPIAEAHALAEALRRAAQLAGLAHQRRLGVSIGVACGPEAGDWTGEALIGLAGRRREAARAAGGDRVQAWGHLALAGVLPGRWPSFGGADRPLPHEQLALF